MGKASSNSFKPHEVEQMARQQQRMNNPNVSNIFGSTTTSFNDDDQSDIVQELSPEMRGIIESQMGFVGQGPAQMGQFSNPFLEQMMQGAANNIQQRWGNDGSPDASNQGGYASIFPQFNQQQAPAPQPPAPVGPTPPQDFGGGGGQGVGDVGRDFTIMPTMGQNPGGGMMGALPNGIDDWSLQQMPEGKSMNSGRSQKGQLPPNGNLAFGIGQDNPNMDTLKKQAQQSLGDRFGMSQNAQTAAGQLGQILQNMKWGNS